ncbi:hypothetical protein AM1_C0109 (plasmid) [Acaryochloris marina MBIC11017]|uniref:Uncharacterized protein n=1 Tax=Acaryochloris marina (strain MBIC 11017) TaxID=329726 RepID=A8ZMK6_ACAM1|nr:hypothetical protein AM1_C0109 [Acaryochloris marina MBIC11017]
MESISCEDSKKTSVENRGLAKQGVKPKTVLRCYGKQAVEKE